MKYCRTFGLQQYLMPFLSFKDLNFFVAEILKSREIFIFIGREGRGSQNREILSSAGNITGMQMYRKHKDKESIKILKDMIIIILCEFSRGMQ
jgi:hypothetical protein